MPRKEKEAEVFESVTDGLKQLYVKKLKPVEEAYKFGEFYSPLLTEGDFDAKPMVLLLGQYSVGKTTFIRYLLGRDFPGQHIGPEPTTDRFIAVMHGREDKQTPGNALAVSPNMPFRGLEMFGNGFLSKFMGAQLDSPLLHHVTLIDTPGILSGEKQRIGRSYDFTTVIEWFAARADVILLLFDAHKLDISDEFKNAIEALKGHDDKIRVVLNKADRVDAQQLLRIYGALMWSLGKVIKSPECVRVYIGSFWDQPLQCNQWSRELLELEMRSLLTDLKNVPKNAAVRKVNELVKRVRLAKAHVYIIGHLKKEMPSYWGKDKAQKKLLDGLEDYFLKIHRAASIPVGDFPDVNKFRATMEVHELAKFPKLDMKAMQGMEDVLTSDIPRLMSMFPQEGTNQGTGEQVAASLAHVTPQEKPAAPQLTYQAPPAAPPAAPPPPAYQQNVPTAPPPGPFGSPVDPFGSPAGWAVTPTDKQRYDQVFASLNPVNGLISGGTVRPVLERSGLPVDALRQVWNLSDIDRDGHLDADEFAVAMHLTRDLAGKPGAQPPASLPPDLIPPSKK
uniref:Calmodulin n=1 Tax=Haptolina ericina TaxID=156174 RepID=A0A6T9E1W8_9EUKA|mmetsp:Transcript_28091/g.63588  ORF Transcript_28091/g.63588 Transcript_28091/m.63588 type:complete len:562 (+) Transcript_28091:20-1705(+)